MKNRTLPREHVHWQYGYSLIRCLESQNHLYLGYEVLIWQPIVVEKKRPHTWEADQPECDVRLCHFYSGTEGKLLNFLYKMKIIVL